ncbi:MAG: discoidin domain-containing protein, partial [Thomasclavelia ramosa]|nr:discoidin domain-containing protein [Thomasclavelia ramosa]
MEKTKVKKLVTSAITLSMAFSTLAPSMVFATDDVKPRDIVTKVNHALNGTATANNSETSYWGPDKAIDGIVNRDAAKPDQSRWSTNMGTTPMVLTIDLKEEKAFSEFKIEWERKNIKGFNISISNDNNEYTPVYTKPDDSNITSLTTTVTLENSVSARYVKLTVDNYDDTEAAGWASVSLYEFEVLGEESYENLAVGATAVASGSETTSFGPANVVDENMKTRWASTANHDDDKWISLDFGTAKDIASVTLKWERRNATKYKIQSSKNGTSWEDVKTLTKAPREFDDIINFDNTINTRYLRVVVSDFENLAEDRDGKSVNWPTVSLYEFEAYAVKQQVDSEQIVTIDDVINNLVIPAVAKGDTKMALPQVPEGFEIEFIGADYEQILDRDLTIHQPIVDTIVSVNYKVKKGDQEKITGAYNVTIPGKNSPDVSINAKPKVVPELAEWVGTEGSFTISDDSRIVINPAYKDDLAYLAKTFKADYQAQTGKEIEVVYANTPGAHDFYFTLGSSDTGLKEEGYLMTVGDSVKVEAVDKTGAFWATQSILQILKQNSNTIPNGQTRDYPKYEVRGFMLDVGRMPYSLDILKDIAKNMAYYKMNDFQVHLNDNYIWVEDYGDNAFDAYSGFRLESDIKAGGNGGLNQADLTSKDVFYTKDQFRTFIQECRDMGVAVVPEFDTPAHSLALTKVRPDLAMKDKSVARHWDHLDLDSMYDESLAFTQSIFNEYMNGDDPVFDQNTTVNVGTDEYDGKYAENFRQYTDDMLKFIQDTGRDVRLWGSLSMRKGSTPVRSENVQMNIWNTSWANPNEMYKQGFDLINMVDGTLYMVPGAGYYNDYLNSQNIYNNWQPNNMGGTIIPAGDEQMLGSAYAIWNDMVDKKANGISEYDIYDRFEKALPAMSSKLWGDGQDLKYNELNEVVNSLGTAPNSNPRDVVTSKSDTVLNYDFNKSEIVDKSGNEYNVVNKKNVATVAGKFSKGLELSGGESYIETPLADMGPNNSVSFWVKMDKDATGEQVLFESDKGSIKMSQKDTGKVGFSRIGYDYSFNYELPKDEWVKLEIKGYANKAELYVNGELVDTLAKNATGGKYATLTLPLERIGSKTTSFKGIIDNLEISTTGSQSDDTDYTKVDSSNFTVSTDNENPQAGNEGPITYAFDNNEVTFWHSNYSPYQALPATVEIDMKEVHTINQFDYLPRQDGNTNGQITKYELYIKENAADEYQKVSEGELAANASLKKITFDAANARYIKFVALEGTGNGGKSFAC